MYQPLSTSRGYNLVGSTAACQLVATTGDQFNVDPRMGPLAANGGPTLTHNLRPDSPAIDAIPADACLLVWFALDQRGIARPQDGDADGEARCDIGAVEWIWLYRVYLPAVWR